jgi:hypothetical protein
MKPVQPKFIFLRGLSLATLLLIVCTASAFVPNGNRFSTGRATSSSSLGVGDDLFENFKRFWGVGNAKDDNKSNQAASSSDEDDAAGTTLIASVPGKLLGPQ